jgi:hypothetical protein
MDSLYLQGFPNPDCGKLNPTPFAMETTWKLVEEWIWSGFDDCGLCCWAHSRSFGPPHETITIGPAAKEIIFRGKRYKVEFSGGDCLLHSLDDLFMDHPAYCLFLEKNS